MNKTEQNAGVASGSLLHFDQGTGQNDAAIKIGIQTGTA
jgi:hypothetical protein